jgi:inosine-uridine nucleoside N-ribohydrolase
MEYSLLTEDRRVSLLQPPIRPARIILDTDTYNEIDDQYALAYALLSPERIEVEAVYAAPFHNDRSSGPEEGMEKSYDEILRVLQRMNRGHEGFVYKGSRRWMPDADTPVQSEAVEDLISRAREDRDDPLYVVAIGAFTNIASAIVAAPDIVSKIVVVWLGGTPTYWHHAREFNLNGDVTASRVLFDCGVPHVFVPCVNVSEHLRTTRAELERFITAHNKLGDYLFEIYCEHQPDVVAQSKVLWDLAPLAWLVNPEWTSTALVHSPILTAERTWSHDPQRHLMREMRGLKRDAIFADVFGKIANCAL